MGLIRVNNFALLSSALTSKIYLGTLINGGGAAPLSLKNYFYTLAPSPLKRSTLWHRLHFKGVYFHLKVYLIFEGKIEDSKNMGDS